MILFSDNLITARHGKTVAGLPVSCTPTTFPAFCRLCAVLRPAGGIFAPVASRVGERPKRKTAVKAICRPYTAFHCLNSISIFPHHQTAYSDPQTARAGHKATPARSVRSKPGYYHLFRARDRTAQRSLSASHQAQNFRAHSISLSILSFFFGLIGRDNQVNSNRGHAL